MAISPEGFKIFFNKFIDEHAEMFRGKHVVDVPAGTGVTSQALIDAGARVSPFDLFPEYFRVVGLVCQRANVLDGIPLQRHTADVVICQEGIEHFSDQYKALQELNRILKPGGVLLLTTPNASNLRSKLSYLFSESERFGSLMPPNELDSVWMVHQQASREIYFGHIFLIGIQKLRVLARLSGFAIAKIHFEQAKPTSVVLFPLLYPFIVLVNLWTYLGNLRKASAVPLARRKEVYGEQLRLSIHPKILVDGTLFVEFTKECDAEEVAGRLTSTHESFDVAT
ncbi:MAG: class I SAM-dependent methyltransferase [Bacteroidota bacterium]